MVYFVVLPSQIKKLVLLEGSNLLWPPPIPPPPIN